MNISDRVTELSNSIAIIRGNYENRLKTEKRPQGLSAAEFGKSLGQQMAAETLLMRQELEALKAPIVSMLLHEGRILIATSGGVFELKGDKLVWLRPQVQGPTAN